MAYQQQLSAALAAAHEAGALLRREFHRPGGPRGTRHHADADPEVELRIYEAITHAFPDYGYLGEELGPRQAAAGPPSDYESHQDWVLIALQNAFYQLLHAPSLEEEGIVDAVMRGGDTDTNAAIAGALLGAVQGREAVPLPWRDRVLTCRPSGRTEARRPRPQPFWPVDALYLAERLLLLRLRGGAEK